MNFGRLSCGRLTCGRFDQRRFDLQKFDLGRIDAQFRSFYLWMLDISISYIMLTFIARDNIQRRDFWQLDFEIGGILKCRQY